LLRKTRSFTARCRSGNAAALSVGKQNVGSQSAVKQNGVLPSNDGNNLPQGLNLLLLLQRHHQHPRLLLVAHLRLLAKQHPVNLHPWKTRSHLFRSLQLANPLQPLLPQNPSLLHQNQ
jgi:hypothetical protein